jgi:phosphoglycolate phosphatase
MGIIQENGSTCYNQTFTMQYDAVIFDIDGTLWDASRASAEGWNSGLAKLGIKIIISSEQIRSVAGNHYEKCVDTILPGLKAKYPGLIQTLNNCETEAVQCRGGDLFSGAIEVVRALAGEFKVFLASNCQEWYLKLFLDFSGLKPVLAGFDCHGLSGLPKNEMLLRIKRNYSLNNPVYVGDTAGDETAARLAGIEYVHVAWSFGKPGKETRTVSSFTELQDYLRGQGRSTRAKPYMIRGRSGGNG